MTVPPLGGGQDRAALAAGHVDADDGDVGRAAGGGDGVAQGDRVAGVGDDDVVGEPGCRASRSASASCGTTPIGAPGAGVAGGGQAQRAGLAGAADDGDDRAVRRTARTTRRGQRRGAADVHHREAERRRAGRRGCVAAIERPKRMA